MPSHLLSPSQPWAPPVVQLLRQQIPAESLATTTVWLPTQGAKRAFRQAWAQSGGGLLPRLITPHGGFEELAPLGLSPALWPTEAQTANALSLLYTALTKAEEGLPPSPATRWQQAQSILNLLEELALASTPPEKLWHSVPTHLAQHWLQNARVLQAVVGSYQTAVQRQDISDIAPLAAKRWQALTTIVSAGPHFVIMPPLQHVAEHAWYAAAINNPQAHVFTLEQTSTAPTNTTYALINAPHRAAEAQAIVAATQQALLQNQTPIVLAVGEPTLATLVTHHLRAAGIVPKGFMPHPLSQTSLGALLQAITAFAGGGELDPRALAHLSQLQSLLVPTHQSSCSLLEQHVFRGAAPKSKKAGGWLAKIRRLPSSKILPEDIEAATLLFQSWQNANLFQPPARGHLGAWCDWLHTALDTLWPAWRTDPQAPTWQTNCTAWHQASYAFDGAAFKVWLTRTLQTWCTEDSATAEPTAPILTGRLAAYNGAQTLIVAGLSDSQWLPTQPHPWLSEGQRKALNLPTNAQAKQLAEAELSHLLASAGATQVILTRSLAEETTPLAPTSLLQQFMSSSPHLAAWQETGASYLSHATAQPIVAAPTSLPYASPESWSPSLLEALLACPYKAALTRLAGQEPWEEFEAWPDARHFGNLLHTAAETFWKDYPTHLVLPTEGPEAIQTLTTLALNQLQKDYPDLTHLWGPRIKGACKALVEEWVKSGTAGWQNVEAESTVTTTLESLVFKARLDKLDTSAEGNWQVIDYKTGSIPNEAELKSGEKPQLPLLAWMLTRKGKPVTQAAFWHLVGYNNRGVEVKLVKDIPAHLQRVEDNLARLVTPFNQGNATTWPATPGLASAGIKPSGPCQKCPAAGWCRYPAWAAQQKANLQNGTSA